MLDENWFARSLSKQSNQEVNVLEVQTTPLLGTGDGYLSATARILVRYQVLGKDAPEQLSSTGDQTWTRELRLFAKFLSSDESQRAFAVKYDIFEREAIVYNDFFPGVQQLVTKDEDLTDSITSIWPKCYHADETMVLLEDLTDSGFKMGDRMKGLSVDDMHCSVKILARYELFTSITVKASNFGPHGYFGPLFQKDILLSKRILKKSEENKSCRITLDRQIRFFHFCYMIRKAMELVKQVQISYFHEV
jgi:hypothetical protein